MRLCFPRKLFSQWSSAGLRIEDPLPYPRVVPAEIPPGLNIGIILAG
jgi:hypothetical protein